MKPRFFLPLALLVLSSLAPPAQAAGKKRVVRLAPTAATSSRTLVARAQTKATGTQRLSVPIGGKQRFFPPLVSGDREFGGNGPKVKVKVRFFVRNNRIYRQVYMSAVENLVGGGLFKSKISVARGWSRPQVVYRAPQGYRIRPFRLTDRRLVSYTDRDHLPNPFTTPIGQVVVYGDRRGDDIGSYTQVFIAYDFDLPIVLEQTHVVATPSAR